MLTASTVTAVNQGRDGFHVCSGVYLYQMSVSVRRVFVCEMSSWRQCCSQSEHRSPAATDTTASVIEPRRLQEETRPDMTGHHKILCDKSCAFISLDD